ncbi:MAG: threonylcarbamoyl-AMP synthase [Dysgonamonadaceae bacterium]|jgi:L-threonylcarbamoyladenylate synthase|nr:threonylcarbamoyl-AMP synthase [Dysgonamonadaceae bacterium]
MEEEVKRACAVLAKGGVILYPTDTVWGIGCDATDIDAVRRVYEIKQRDDAKSMLVLIDSAEHLAHYVEALPAIAMELVTVSENPLTVIYEGARNLASNLIAADGTIGIRVTNEDFSHALCRRFRKPVVSTSANLSGAPSPATFAEIDAAIIQAVDYVVNYRRDDLRRARPSSIIKLGNKGEIQIIRQ